jgi:hypothetical protein
MYVPGSGPNPLIDLARTSISRVGDAKAAIRPHSYSAWVGRGVGRYPPLSDTARGATSTRTEPCLRPLNGSLIFLVC